jgi:hypothetical protein
MVSAVANGPKTLLYTLKKPTEIKKLKKPVQFTDKSKNNSDHWLWNFGDGTQTSILQNPHTHTIVQVNICNSQCNEFYR